MTALSYRRVIDRTILFDMQRRDWQSARDWFVSITVGFGVIVLALVASFGG